MQAHDIMAAGAAAALAVAGPASASTATQSVRSFIFPVKTTTTVRAQALGDGGVWATVTVPRTATVSGGIPVLPFDCGPGAIRCFGYSAVVKDTGSFRAYRFALTPNRFIPGRHIRSVVTGRVDGSYSFAFFASTAPSAFIVPVLLQAVLRRGQLAEAVLGRLDQVRAAALDRLVHERARQPALGREHHRLLAPRKPR